MRRLEVFVATSVEYNKFSRSLSRVLAGKLSTAFALVVVNGFNSLKTLQR